MTVAGGFLEQMLTDFVRSLGENTGTAFAKTTTFWVGADTPNPDVPGLQRIREQLLPISAVILVCSGFIQLARMAIVRKAEPAVQAGFGLAQYLIVNAVGMTVLVGSIQAADAFTESVLAEPILGFSKIVGELFVDSELFALGSLLIGVLLIIVVGLLTLIQWVLMEMREAGMVVIAVIVQVAAAGRMTQATRGWLPRAGGWLIALVLYKPMAGVIYAIGFAMLSAPKRNAADVVAALVVILTAILAMPAMMKFFSWTGVAATGGAGAASVVAGAAVGAIAVAALRGGGAAAAGRLGSSRPEPPASGAVDGGGWRPQLPSGGGAAGLPSAQRPALPPGGGGGGGLPPGGRPPEGLPPGGGAPRALPPGGSGSSGPAAGGPGGGGPTPRPVAGAGGGVPPAAAAAASAAALFPAAAAAAGRLAQGAAQTVSEPPRPESR